MIKINQLKMSCDHKAEDFDKKLRKLLGLQAEEFSYQIVRRAIDARKKPNIIYVYNLAVWLSKGSKAEEALVKKLHNPSITVGKENAYQVPMTGTERLGHRPIIVGAGPAGFFCAYLLTLQGYRPIVLERGSAIEKRKQDVQKFWETGILDTASNVQFGEGGAGTFSDGKLNTATKDPSGRIRYVLETFVRYGAPEQIVYDQKPHIGTDILAEVMVAMRKDLIEKGCEFYFDTQVMDLVVENQRVTRVITKDKEYEASVVVLALGHSARDSFAMLLDKGLPMEQKEFAVGFRVEHPQEMINEAMYGSYGDRLPAAPYKVTSNFPNGRGVYSFCMCPGGYVVNASSKEKALVVNGMSYAKRDSQNANSAIIVSVGPTEFGATDALAGMRYQEQLEQKAYALANGSIPQQLFGDYEERRQSSAYGAYTSVTKGKTAFANLRGLLSEEMEDSFCQGMHHFGKIIPGFDRPDAILSGIESRTSSPVRMLRDENFESECKGIYPCGEGAGYAGGITSAAMDGLKVAEAIIMRYCP